MIETLSEKRPIGYARVSISGQTLDSQLEQLHTAGCSSRNIYREKVIGARGPTGASLTATLPVWSLARRSASDRRAVGHLAAAEDSRCLTTKPPGLPRSDFRPGPRG